MSRPGPGRNRLGNVRRRVRRGTNPDGSTWEEEVYEESSSSTLAGRSTPFSWPPAGFQAGSFSSWMNGSDAFFQNAFKTFQEMRGGRAPHPPTPFMPEVVLGLDEAYSGVERQVDLPDGRHPIVSVPAGVEDGRVIQLRMPEGAVPVRVRVRAEPRFGRRGRHLSTVVPVPRPVLEQGGEATAPLAGGGFVTVRIPAGITPGTCLRVGRKGMPDVDGGDPGDLYIYVVTSS